MKLMNDVHSHILPGIDDGAKDFDESVEMVRELAAQGIERVVATPHYIPETSYTSARVENLKLVEELRRRLAAAGVFVEVALGNEIYINKNVDELVRTGVASSLVGSRYVLVELPLNDEYAGAKDVLAELVRKGYKVVLAHPERYAVVQKDLAVVEELRGVGVLLQCNFGSLVGQYGKSAQKTVTALARRGMVYAFGSDVHRVRGAKYWHGVKEKLWKCYDAAGLEQVLVRNPREIWGF